MIKSILKIILYLDARRTERYQILAAAKAIAINEKAKETIRIYSDDYSSLLKHVALLIWRKEKEGETHLFNIHKACKLKYTKPEPVLFYAMVREEMLKLLPCQP